MLLSIAEKMMKEIRMQDIEEMNLNYVELCVTDEKRAAYVLTEKMGLQNFKILDSGKIRIYDHAVSTAVDENTGSE